MADPEVISIQGWDLNFLEWQEDLAHVARLGKNANDGRGPFMAEYEQTLANNCFPGGMLLYCTDMY